LACRFGSSRQRHISWVYRKCFFGIEQGDNQSASVNHYDFGIENFNADAIRARLTELNLKFSGTSQESFKFNDPDGFLVQVNGPDYIGHV
jgi:hypothetical protein